LLNYSLFDDATQKGSVIKSLKEVMVHKEKEAHAMFKEDSFKRQTETILMNAHSR
jgi:hypothetical protein